MNEKRRQLIKAIAALLVASHAVAQPRPVPRVAWLLAPGGIVRGQDRDEWFKTLLEHFAKQGLIEGRDFAITIEAPIDPRLSEEEWLQTVVARRPAVITGLAHLYLPTLMRLTREIPIVFHNLTADPVELGFVETLRRPGGNVTGTMTPLRWDERELSLLRLFDPRMRVVVRLIDKETWDLIQRNPSFAIATRHYEEHRKKAADLGVHLRDLILPKDSSTDAIAKAVRKSGAQGLVITSTESLTNASSLYSSPMTAQVVEFLKECPTPSVCRGFLYVRMGVLVGISGDFFEGRSQAIGMVARILHGENPATIPIYQQSLYWIAINLRTAASAGIRVPDSIMAQALEIYR